MNMDLDHDGGVPVLCSECHRLGKGNVCVCDKDDDDYDEDESETDRKRRKAIEVKEKQIEAIEGLGKDVEGNAAILKQLKEEFHQSIIDEALQFVENDFALELRALLTCEESILSNF